MLIVSPCVDPHSVELRCVLDLKCCRLHEMLDVMLVYSVLITPFCIIKQEVFSCFWDSLKSLILLIPKKCNERFVVIFKFTSSSSGLAQTRPLLAVCSF